MLETLSVTTQFLAQTEGSPLAFNGGNPLAAPKTARPGGWVRRVGVSRFAVEGESNVDAIAKVKVDAKRFVQNGGLK